MNYAPHLKNVVPLAAASALLTLAACGGISQNNERYEPWPNSDVEHSARVAAATRSDCDVVTVQDMKQPNNQVGSARDTIKVTLRTKRDPTKQATILPYENYLDRSGNPVPDVDESAAESNGYTRNPHGNRIMWGPLSPVAKINNNIGVLPRDRGGSFVDDNSSATSFLLAPKNDYPKNAHMAILVSSSVTSEVGESIGRSKEDGARVSLVQVEKAVGTVSCGELVQTGNRKEGAAGWVVVSNPIQQAPKTVESHEVQEWR